MKLFAREVPYSSTVGGGLALVDEQGATRFQVAFIGQAQGITKEETNDLVRQFLWFINEIGIEMPDQQ